MKPTITPPSSDLRSTRLPDTFQMTSTLLALGTIATPMAHAAEETTSDEKKDGEQATELPQMVVQADGRKTYKPEKLATPKFTAPIRDIPQTITVIPREIMQEQNATSLRDVLRNVPGISMQAGEGGGGLPGDNLSIRGFNSRNDIFVDGVRDIGGLSRDPFNVEQVEVSKGPASTNTGRGSTGGSINLASKAPRLETFNAASVGVGSDNYYRGTLDVNQAITQLPGAAFRLNGVFHSQDIPGRDVVDEERWGIAPSIAFGLGTETRFTLSYFHLDQNNTPDYGLPWVPNNGTTYLNGLGSYIDEAPPVSYSNFYGLRDYDFEDVQSDQFTALFEHDFCEEVMLQNITRYGRNDRDSAITAPRFADVDVGAGVTYDGTLNRQLQRREQITEYWTNLLNLNLEFETGPLSHAVATGAEVTLERQMNRNSAQNTNQPQTNVFDPNPSDDPLGPMPDIANPFVESHLDTFGLYAFDTIRYGEHWMFTGGARYDHIEGDSGTFSSSDDLLSWRAAITYKPVENGSIYAGVGTSFNPSIDGNTGLGLTDAIDSLDPEETETFELGTKWDLYDGRLGLSAAIFHTEKTNARTPGLVPGTTVLAGDQTVDGLELGVVGQITDRWQVLAGYTYMDSETEDSGTAAEVGEALANTPDHSFSLWTTVNVTDEITGGLGVNYVGERNNNNSNVRTAPDFITVDAMASYDITEWCTLQLNIYNLFDEEYIDRVGGGHFIPGAGRSATLSANFTF